MLRGADDGGKTVATGVHVIGRRASRRVPANDPAHEAPPVRGYHGKPFAAVTEPCSTAPPC